MKCWELDVSFATPAFLGDADQRGMWRTPPFKALLRHWWRIAVAKDCRYDVHELRRRELALFGSAAGETGGKSKVRLRLGEWKKGSLGQWPKDGFSRIDRQVRADVYLGFGPVNFRGRLERAPAIGPDQKMTLRVWLTDVARDEEAAIERAIQLAAWFGTLGSRSRNGWGSVMLHGKGIDSARLEPSVLADMLEPWQQCLEREWSSAIGRDEEGALVWLDHAGDWKQAVNKLARLRKDLRAVAKGFSGPGIKGSVLLGYPLTKHSAPVLVKDARIPNQLRFKAIRDEHGYRVIAVHLPCAMPTSVWKDQAERAMRWVAAHQWDVWHKVHRVLDERMERIGGVA